MTSEPVDRLRHGERRFATVLFSDMKGFTTFSEGRDPEEIDRLMSSVFSRFAEIIHRHGGSVEKYIGDALVAVFGVPRVHDDDAIRAIGAAWEFRDILSRDHPELKFRTGIHSGLITTGKRGQYDVVTGHALAVAARLETAAEPGGILVSSEAYKVARRSFTFSEPTEIRARGREDKIEARLVTERRTLLVDEDEPFVGRDGLLKDMTGRYLGAVGGKSSSVVLTGDPGMGASVVAYRFAREMKGFPRFDAAIILTRPSQFSSSPYSAIWNATRQFFDVDDRCSHDDVVESLRRASACDEEDLEPAALFLVDGGAGTEQSELYRTVSILLQVVLNPSSHVFPSIFVVDNFHDLSPDEQDLFRFLIHRGDMDSFFVATTKEQVNEAVDILPNATVMQISPLSLEETAALIMELKHGTPDDDFVADVYARTGGNPTFVRELFRYLETHPDTGDIPVGIQTVVLAGLQSLPDDAQRLLQYLSVLDHPFRSEDAQRLSGDGFDPDTLDSLVNHRYLRRDGPRHTFVNELVRKSIYDSLLNHNKRVLHGAAADSVANDELPPVVRIRHLVRAERFVDAAAEISGLRGRVMNTDRRLLGPIDTVIGSPAATDSDVRSELLYMRLAILFNTHAGESEIRDSIRELLKLGMETHRSELMGRAYAFLLGRYARGGALHAARHAGFQALRHYRLAGSSQRTDSVLWFLSGVCQRLGRDDECATAIGDIESPSVRFSALSEQAVANQDYQSAYDYAVKSLESGAEAPAQIARFQVAAALSLLCRVLLECGAWQEIYDLRERVDGIIGPWFGRIAMAYSALAVAAHHLGNHEEAMAHLERAAYYSKQSMNSIRWYESALALALARIELGQPDAALTDLERVFIDLAEEPYEDAMVSCLALMLRALADRDLDRSRFYLIELDSLVDDMPVARDYHRMIAGWYRYRAGDDEDAAGILAETFNLANRILERQGDGKFSTTLRDVYPYREILAEWKGKKPS